MQQSNNRHASSRLKIRRALPLGKSSFTVVLCRGVNRFCELKREGINIPLFMSLGGNRRRGGLALGRLRIKGGLFPGENEEKGNNKIAVTTTITLPPFTKEKDTLSF